MKIGVTSQNFRTITGHAGKARRFILFSVDDQQQAQESGRLDLPLELSMHEYHGTDHPLLQLDVIITGGCGQGFSGRMAAHGVRVITTGETDPLLAVNKLLQGQPLAPALPHDDDHHHEHEVGQSKTTATVELKLP